MTLQMDKERGERKSDWDEAARTPLVCSHTSGIWLSNRGDPGPCLHNPSDPLWQLHWPENSISFWRNIETTSGKEKGHWAGILSLLVTSYMTVGKSRLRAWVSSLAKWWETHFGLLWGLSYSNYKVSRTGLGTTEALDGCLLNKGLKSGVRITRITPHCWVTLHFQSLVHSLSQLIPSQLLPVTVDNQIFVDCPNKWSV